ncbi:MAG TPA: hypothetical protein VKQ30_02850 [Ktedonobacterales bacterium]|nr:hypothetical protein [Ktedonobacterales bacterium]
MTERTDLVRTPIFPLYSDVRQLLTLLDGVPKPLVTGLIQRVHDQMGTPQNPVDWSDPDTWIPERLAGDQAAFAQRIWHQTDHTVNPRYIDGAYLFINSEKLLVPDAARIYHLSARGTAFLQDDPALVRELDTHEGLPQLLEILATKTRAMRGGPLTGVECLSGRAFTVRHAHDR